MVTKRTVNHLKPKKQKQKTKTCPHRSEYDALDSSLIMININNHTLFSVKHMANTESQNNNNRIKKQDIHVDNGRKRLYKKIN